MSIALTSLVALLSYGLLHQRGIRLDSDGWAAWQGAVSLFAGKGYVYFSGHPIVAWPPLYSVYLCLWTFVLGATGWSLLVANAVLVALQGCLWMWLGLAIARDSGQKPVGRHLYLLAIYVGVFVALNGQQVFAHNLVYALLPIFVYATWRFLSATAGAAKAWTLALAIASGTALLLAHNASVAFVGSAAILMAARRPASWRSVGEAILALGAPLAGWFAVRLVLGQTRSHHIGLRAGQRNAFDYAVQLLDGLGQLFVPPRLGAPFVAILLFMTIIFWLVRSKASSGLRFGAIFALLSTAIVFVLFNVTWLATPLTSARQTMFVVLILAPLVYLTVSASKPRVAAVALTAVLAVQLYWIALYALGRAQVPTGYWVPLNEALRQAGSSHKFGPAEFPNDSVVPADAYITLAYPVGPPIVTSKGLLIAPMSYEEPVDRRR